MNHSNLSRMDPQARRFLAMVALGVAASGKVVIAERRASFEKLMRLSRPPTAAIETVDTVGAGCTVGIPLRIYDPDTTRKTIPGLIYFHGGGLVAGSIETHDVLCKSLAHQSGCRVLSVGYRLAPEHPFPAAIIDALMAVRHITRHPEIYGLARDRIAIGGDSGGATLATIIAQIMRKGTFKAQVLLCPVLDFAGAHTSRLTFADGFLLDATTMENDLAHYAPTRALDHPRVSPLQARSLDGLPPTIIHTAGYDPLRDEGIAYATRLEAAGIPVTHTCHETLIHHFYGLTAVIPAAVTALSAIARDINEALA